LFAALVWRARTFVTWDLDKRVTSCCWLRRRPARRRGNPFPTNASRYTKLTFATTSQFSLTD